LAETENLRDGLLERKGYTPSSKKQESGWTREEPVVVASASPVALPAA
jgi:hypothetical protein